MRGLIEAVEASYRAVASANADEWIEVTTRAVSSLIDTGSGVLGYRFDARGDPQDWTISTPYVHDGAPEYALATTTLFAIASPAFRVALYRPRQGRTHLLSEMSGHTLDALPLGNAPDFAQKLGIVDFIGLHGGNPNGLGAMFAAACPKRTSLRAAKRAALARLTGHLASAYRLVVAMEQKTRAFEPEAIFDAGGRMLDARPTAQRAEAPLRAAVREMDRARGALRRKDPAEALERWRALVDGRYSLLDRFESDGKRFVVAYPNAPGTRDPRGLTEQERAVAGLLALALPDKTIAYELGLSAGTVRAHVHAVLQKLNVSSRAGAIDALLPVTSVEDMSLDESTPLVVFHDEIEEESAELSKLTKTEQKIARLVVRGMSTASIAARRKRSTATVAKQIARIFSKLGVRSRAELVRHLRG